MQVMKGNPATQDVPVVFYALSKDLDSGSILGLDHLTKPLGNAELARALDRQGLGPDACKEGRTVLVVDDVMYRGHSMLRAVEYLACKQPAEIRTVVLVDRGAAKLPVRTDIVGMRLDVAPSDIIECNEMQ